jgi:hypothetical protein
MDPVVYWIHRLTNKGNEMSMPKSVIEQMVFVRFPGCVMEHYKQEFMDWMDERIPTAHMWVDEGVVALLCDEVSITYEFDHWVFLNC